MGRAPKNMAQVITANDCGNMLAVFLGRRASTENAKELAKAVGYNDFPFFGAKKKRVALISERVIFYSALVIFASNRICSQAATKAVVDAFLSTPRAESSLILKSNCRASLASTLRGWRSTSLFFIKTKRR
jgi:hypothetical protein